MIGSFRTRPRNPLCTQSTLERLKAVIEWTLACSLFLWGARYVYLEGFLFAIERGFVGDLNAVVTQEWDGRGLYYGPVFVMEYIFLLQPGLIPLEVVAFSNYAIFLLAFVCAYFALLRPLGPKILVIVAGLWLSHFSTAEALSSNAHLEIVELAFISSGLLLLTHGKHVLAGASIGVATATKVLPSLFIFYFLVTRKWSMLIASLAVAGAIFLCACWIQGLSPGEGVASLIYQQGTLVRATTGIHGVDTRSAIGRRLNGTEPLAPEQIQIAVVLHLVLATAAVGMAALLVRRREILRDQPGLVLGLVAATMLAASPVAHLSYFILLYPAWTAAFTFLLSQPLTLRVFGLWCALLLSYFFNGLPTGLMVVERLAGLPVWTQWTSWDLPIVGVWLLFASLAVMVAALQPVAVREDRKSQPRVVAASP